VNKETFGHVLQFSSGRLQNCYFMHFIKLFASIDVSRHLNLFRYINFSDKFYGTEGVISEAFPLGATQQCFWTIFEHITNQIQGADSG
jgi:hypothetical protein